MILADKHRRAIDEAAARLISRAANARGLGVDEISARLSPAVEKYLLRDGADLSASEIGNFIDEIHADDLCLIVACERSDDKAMVAQSGRVRVKADARYCAIRIGDLLVTSPTPGYAMRSKAKRVGGSWIHRPGTLLGKALEALPDGQGEILVLLTLQ